MIQAMTLKEYLLAMEGKEKDPLLMASLLEPFAMSFQSDAHHDLDVGSFLLALACDFMPGEWIDPSDVAEAAWSLGYSPAKDFLEQCFKTQGYRQSLPGILLTS